MQSTAPYPRISLSLLGRTRRSQPGNPPTSDLRHPNATVQIFLVACFARQPPTLGRTQTLARCDHCARLSCSVLDNTGQSSFRNFLQAAGSFPDCARLTRRRCWLHDLRPLDPGSTQFPRHLSLRVALCAPRLVPWWRVVEPIKQPERTLASQGDARLTINYPLSLLQSSLDYELVHRRPHQVGCGLQLFLNVLGDAGRDALCCGTRHGSLRHDGRCPMVRWWRHFVTSCC